MYLLADISVTAFPPSDSLPSDVAELIAQRDAAYDELANFEEEWADVLADNWRTIAEAKDIESAVNAARAGKDGLKGTSEVAKARDARPRVVGVHRVLTQNLRAAERAAQRAFRPAAETLEPDALVRLRESAQEAENAYRRFMDARAAFGAATGIVRFVRGWQNGDRPDYNDTPQNPLRADSMVPEASEPIAEIREVIASFEAPFTADPLVTVHTANGQTLELRRSQADALVGSANSGVTLADA
ncbi:hypothetical protein [Streptomyces griseoflavus]|uniref:hypothetical protein n=1 Tax=Streptomyces griseoflavus TaxID=35619 RepID=UPI0001B4E2E9|nr:hypothetical protein [Streptomyces griseoflavus]